MKTALQSLGVFFIAGFLMLAAVWPCLNSDLAVMDDRLFLNAIPTEGSWLADLQAIVKVYKSIFLPLTGLTYRIDALIAGGKDGNFAAVARLANIFYTALAGVLLFHFWVRRREEALLAALAAILFCVHPLHFSSLVWIFTRKDILVCVGMVATVLFYHRGRWGWAAFFFALALFSKLSAYGLLLWLVTREIVQMKRLSDRTTWGQAAKRLAPFFLLTAVFLPLLTRQSTYVHVVKWVTGETPLLFWFYVKKVLWPWPLVKLYPQILPLPRAQAFAITAAGIALFVGLVALARVFKKQEWLVRFVEELALALAFIIPYIVVVPIHLLVYDPYAFSFVAPVIGMILTLCLFISRYRRARACCAGLLLAGILMSFGYDRAMATDYKDPLGVYERNIAVYPNEFLAQIRLAKAAEALGRYPRVVQAYETAMDQTVQFYGRVNPNLFSDLLRAALTAGDRGALTRLANLSARNSSPLYCLEMARERKREKLLQTLSLERCRKRYPEAMAKVERETSE